MPRHHSLSWYHPARSLPFTHLPHRLVAEDTYMGSSTGTFNLLTMTCGTAMGETSDAQLMHRNCIPRWMTRRLSPRRPCVALMLSHKPQEPIPHTTQLTSCTFHWDAVQHMSLCVPLSQHSAIPMSMSKCGTGWQDMWDAIAGCVGMHGMRWDMWDAMAGHMGAHGMQWRDVWDAIAGHVGAHGMRRRDVWDAMAGCVGVHGM